MKKGVLKGTGIIPNAGDITIINITKNNIVKDLRIMTTTTMMIMNIPAIEGIKDVRPE